jgi:hypothetical protein
MCRMAAEIGLDTARHRNLEGRNYEPWFRRAALGLLLLLPLCALSNLLGQQPSTDEGNGTAATVTVRAPATVRGGLLFQSSFTIDARQEIAEPVLHLDQGWLENITLNTLEPAPVDEAWKDGGLELTFPKLPAGDQLKVYIQYQVNPTAVGRQSQDVELLDGETVLASIDRTLTILP